MKNLLVLLLIVCSITARSQNYLRTGIKDTARCVLYITVCDSCDGKFIPAYAIRQIYVYWDAKPCSNCPDKKKVIAYLDVHKKRFPKTTTVWDCRIK